MGEGVTCTKCNRAVLGRGFCPTHYSEWYRRANAEKYTHICTHCNAEFKTWRKTMGACSPECSSRESLKAARPVRVAQMKAAAAAKPPPEPKLPLPIEQLEAQWKAQRSRFRAAFEDGDWSSFLEELSARCNHTPNGCWEWRGKAKASVSGKPGYPVVTWGRAHLQVHRLALEAKHGAPLGTQQSHHACANTICVNPAHLQAATQVENMAEMKARRSYEARINELEKALRKVAPDHEALNRIGYGRTA